ncbi:MAG: hypothetical protein HPY61_09415 [Methanotrichaceae archaeon]|nr:hypothetical protein [Methanotrichaceae archaeon]
MALDAGLGRPFPGIAKISGQELGSEKGSSLFCAANLKIPKSGMKRLAHEIDKQDKNQVNSEGGNEILDDFCPPAYPQNLARLFAELCG